MKATRKNLLHGGFRIGILLKGLDGLLETAGGALVWLVQPVSAENFVRQLIGLVLEVDRHQYFAHLFLRSAHNFTGARWYASFFLLSHGAMKLVLVAALWKNRRWAYPTMIGMLLAFGVFQTVRFAQTQAVFLAVLTVFDLLFAALTWWEYGEEKRRLSAESGRSPSLKKYGRDVSPVGAPQDGKQRERARRRART